MNASSGDVNSLCVVILDILHNDCLIYLGYSNDSRIKRMKHIIG